MKKSLPVAKVASIAILLVAFIAPSMAIHPIPGGEIGGNFRLKRCGSWYGWEGYRFEQCLKHEDIKRDDDDKGDLEPIGG